MEFNIFLLLFRPYQGHAWTMFGPFLPSFASRVARAPKFYMLMQPGPRDMSMECLISKTMPGPCLDYVRAMIGLVLLHGNLEVQNNQE